jgi:hypothetical protein
MKIETNFSNKGLKHIRWWTWAAAILPITGLSLIFFIWFFGLDKAKDIFMIAVSTTMFCAAAIWWWWIIWIVSCILKKDKYIAEELKNTVNDIRDLKVIVKETYKVDK